MELIHKPTHLDFAVKLVTLYGIHFIYYMSISITVLHGMLSLCLHHSGTDQTTSYGRPQCYVNIILLKDYQVILINYILNNNLVLLQVSCFLDMIPEFEILTGYVF